MVAISSNQAAVEYGTDVVTPDDEPVREPVDPVYASLFRPEEPVEPAIAEPEAVGPEPHTRLEIDEADVQGDEQPESVPEGIPSAVPASAVDTGRLFRSQGVVGNETPVLALTSDHGGKLRTLVRLQDDPSLPVQVNSATAPDTAAVIIDDAVLDDEPVKESRADRRRQRAPREIAVRSVGISAGAVYIIVIGTTFVVGLLNAWIGSGELGAPTGIALLVSSAYCAWRVRREDDVVAILTPPIAFFIAAITAGQMFRGSSGGGLLNRAQLVFFTMAYNWYWVIGATIVALVLVLVRRQRG